MMIHNVFTKKQAMLTMNITELVKRVSEGTILIREVNHTHVRAIKRYIFDNCHNGQVYFPPIVAHLDEGTLEGGANGILSLSTAHTGSKPMFKQRN